MTTEPITLVTPLSALPGVGPRRGVALRRMGLRCAADLLVHLPFRYERQLAARPMADVAKTVQRTDEQAVLTVCGEVVATRRSGRGPKPRFEARIEDESGSMMLTWFNAGWLQDRIRPGMRLEVSGRVKPYQGMLQMVNPQWKAAEVMRLPGEASENEDDRLIPIYPASEEITSRMIEGLVERVLDPALALIDDHLDDAQRSRHDLIPLAEAYRAVHRPQCTSDADRGRRRLAYDELLLLQLAVMMKRWERREQSQAFALPDTPEIAARIRARMPFTLTEDQERTDREIAADLALTRPMNRLLQGDVGSGKTAVAACAMLRAVAGETQAALMAPTELLAEQHFASLSALLAGSRVRIDLLTGSMRTAARRDAIKRIAGGESNLIVGTHALLSESVAFKALSVVVVDEQHRFGVHQRAVLRSRGEGERVPHVLVMTATPIPRTLTLTLFGDLDVSTIRSRPPGRRAVATRHVPGERREEVYELAKTKLAAGERLFVVVPVIEESESDLTDVRTHLAWLEAGPLKGFRIAAMHGRMHADERSDIMERFRTGALDALVATTVIEVGVDVPEATMIIIEHAERFHGQTVTI